MGGQLDDHTPISVCLSAITRLTAFSCSPPPPSVRASVSAERRTATGGLGEIAAIEAELRRLDSKISAAVQGGWMQPGEARDSRIDVLSVSRISCIAILQ